MHTPGWGLLTNTGVSDHLGKVTKSEAAVGLNLWVLGQPMGQPPLNLTGQAILDQAEFQGNKQIKGYPSGKIQFVSQAVIRSCSLSPLPSTHLELQRWGAAVGPALNRQRGSWWAEPRDGVSHLRKALWAVMCQSIGKSSYEKPCRCLCHQTLLLLWNPTVLRVAWHESLASLFEFLSCFVCIRWRLSLSL